MKTKSGVGKGANTIKRGRKPKTDALRPVRRQTVALYDDQCVALKAIANGGSYADLIRTAIDGWIASYISAKQ